MFLSKFPKTRMLNSISKMNSSSSFAILEDIPTDSSVPQFTVGRKNGFLPWGMPLARLPEPFQIIDQILDEAPYYKRDGTPGLMATGSFGQYVKENLPLLDVSNIKDSAILYALYRDYTFLTSQYLLEPCRLHYIATDKQDYGYGRNRLPANIAVPLSNLAKQLGAKPFMEFNCYTTYNWQKIDPQGNCDAHNIKLIRHLEGSQDETGFVAAHVAMLKHSGDFVSNVQDVLDAAEKKDRTNFDIALRNILTTCEIINDKMYSSWPDKMFSLWEYCNSKSYKNFHTYIKGTKRSPMFPNGVIYEGVSDKPTFYHGVSFAIDSIFPTLYNLLEITEQKPGDPFLEILNDLSTNRPVNHTKYLTYVEEQTRKVGVSQFAVQDDNSTVLYIALLNEVFRFRSHQWDFTANSKRLPPKTNSPFLSYLIDQQRMINLIILKFNGLINQDKLTQENKNLLSSFMFGHFYFVDDGWRRFRIDFNQLEKRQPVQDIDL